MWFIIESDTHDVLGLVSRKARYWGYWMIECDTDDVLCLVLSVD